MATCWKNIASLNIACLWSAIGTNLMSCFTLGPLAQGQTKTILWICCLPLGCQKSTHTHTHTREDNTDSNRSLKRVCVCVNVYSSLKITGPSSRSNLENTFARFRAGHWIPLLAFKSKNHLGGEPKPTWWTHWGVTRRGSGD